MGKTAREAEGGPRPQLEQGSAPTRRRFLKTSACVAAAATGAPLVHTAAKGTSPLIIGQGAFRYEVQHDWPQLPDRFTWQTTHNVAVDRNGFLYVIHEGRRELPDHPAIFVFDPEGRYVRSLGKMFQGGGHGLEIRQEGRDEFLYVCAYQHLKTFVKLDMKGEIVWQRFAPMDAGGYAKGEDTQPKRIWGRDRFMPTNIAFLEDGSFLVADGYGSYRIHHYDKGANWLRCFGGPGKGEGTFQLPHGLWVVRKKNGESEIVVCDRAHHTLQYFSRDFRYLRTQTGFGLPANVDTHEGLMVVPELRARVTLLDESGSVVARLGDDTARIGADKKFTIRRSPDQWRLGRFVHPHDACFDADGNIYVAEWVATGRVTRLRRV